MKYVLGIDLGTSSLKGLLVNEMGETIASKSEEYPLITIKTGYSEQDPQQWINAFDKVMSAIIKEQPDVKENLEGISFSGQMHSLVLLDKNDKILRNAILWNDVRTTKQCEKIMDSFPDDILSITKNRALEGFTLPKLLWVKENEPEIFSNIDKFMLPKDYLGFYLTGNKQMEYSDAAGTLLLDIQKKKWSFEIMNHFDIPSNIFVKLCNSYDQIGLVKLDLLAKFDIKNEVKVFAGGADNACAAIGSGISGNGIGMCSIGTSGVFLSYEEDAKKDYNGDLHYFNHVNNAYYSMGVTLSAGSSLNWFVTNFCEKKSFEEALANIKDIPVGSEGLLFTPYLVGERSPYFDAEVRGSFIGIDARHTNNHFARSVLEGITFSLRDSQTLMEKVTNRKFERIISVGGGAKNRDWLQMQADIFNATIMTLKGEQGPALGASMIAAVGLLWFENFEECIKKFVKYKTEEVKPIQKNVEAYNRLYNLYKEVYPCTKGITHALLKLNI